MHIEITRTSIFTLQFHILSIVHYDFQPSNSKTNFYINIRRLVNSSFREVEV